MTDLKKGRRTKEPGGLIETIVVKISADLHGHICTLKKKRGGTTTLSDIVRSLLWQAVEKKGKK